MAEPSPQARATVLVVDDEDALRGLLARVLAQAGFAVLEAADGERALQVVRSFDGQLSVVLTDLDMPVMNGIEFYRIFRPLYPTIPIVFITGKGLTDSEFSSSIDSMSQVLWKPFSPEMLLETVRRMAPPAVSGGRIPA